MSEKERSLKALFLLSQKRQNELEKLDPRSEDFKDTQREAVKALDDCREVIANMALYSSNEEVDDIATHDLQYLVVDFLLAELLLKAYNADRLSQLKRASELLESFLTRLDHYDILSTHGRRILERYQEDRTSFSVVTATNPEERRNAKVARFREEKALKEQLKLLRDQSTANHVDDEILRKLYLAELTLSTHQAFQSLDLISQELSILARMPPPGQLRPSATADDDARKRQGRNDGYSERLDGPTTLGGLGQRGGPLLDSKGKPLQPFTLTNKRTELQKGVFRSGHNLPTMSIDEYLEEEKKRGGIIEGGGNADAPQAEPDEDNMEHVDAATYKAREWDEFVEANPKGAGNTINRG